MRRNSTPSGSWHDLRNQEGFLLLGVLFMVLLITFALAVAAPKIAEEIRRDKEEETIHRGKQYARAIQNYYAKYNRYPNSIDQLMKTDNQRFLRKRYLDPMTGKDDWRIIHLGEATVPAMGLFGQSLQQPNGGITPTGATNGTNGTNGTGVTSNSSFGSFLRLRPLALRDLRSVAAARPSDLRLRPSAVAPGRHSATAAHPLRRLAALVPAPVVVSALAPAVASVPARAVGSVRLLESGERPQLGEQPRPLPQEPPGAAAPSAHPALPLAVHQSWELACSTREHRSRSTGSRRPTTNGNLSSIPPRTLSTPWPAPPRTSPTARTVVPLPASAPARVLDSDPVLVLDSALVRDLDLVLAPVLDSGLTRDLDSVLAPVLDSAPALVLVLGPALVLVLARVTDQVMALVPVDHQARQTRIRRTATRPSRIADPDTVSGDCNSPYRF